MIFAPGAVSMASAAEPGDDVYIGSKVGYGGTGLFPIWADGVQEGEPDFWAYCLENRVTDKVNVIGHVGSLDDYLGSNYFTDPVIQGKVFWVLAHSYPALSLEEFGEASGVPGISRNDAIEATQYAIWRYTDITFDAEWSYETEDVRTAYWHLIDGANSSSGMTPADFDVTAGITAPAGSQTAGTLVGPFVVTTNQPTVTVSVDPALTVTDADGDPIDLGTVVNGQEIYLDLRSVTTAGEATVTVAAQGSGSTGNIISVPTVPGETPTPEDHAQTIILVAPATKTTDAHAEVTWAPQADEPEPSIGTSLVDFADGDRVLPWNGGTAIDTVTYENLTPDVEYTLTGELMRKSDGSATGITGSVTFTPTTANGSVDVTFTVPEGYGGQSLVAFEWLYEGTDTTGDPVAVHDDLEDFAQTISIEEPTTPVTPDEPDTLPKTGGDVPVTLIGAAAALLFFGALLVVRRRRESSVQEQRA